MAVLWQCLSLMQSFSVASVNMAVSHILLKTRFFGLHFCCRRYGSIVNHCDIIGPKATEFGEVTQNKGYYAVQCDFLLVINTNLHPISHYFEVIADDCSNLVWKRLLRFLSPNQWQYVWCSSQAHWKARSGLPISDNWTMFWGATSEYRLEIAVVLKDGVTLTQNFMYKGRPQKPFFVSWAN